MSNYESYLKAREYFMHKLQEARTLYPDLVSYYKSMIFQMLKLNPIIKEEEEKIK